MWANRIIELYFLPIIVFSFSSSSDRGQGGGAAGEDQRDHHHERRQQPHERRGDEAAGRAPRDRQRPYRGGHDEGNAADVTLYIPAVT